MVTVTTRAALRAELEAARSDAAVLGGGRVAFVPTAGGLHDGHLRLVDLARERGDIVVMSIVEDSRVESGDALARPGRDPERDASQARDRGVHLLFVPHLDELSPRTPRVRVTPGPLGERWEGAVRPGHFAAVLTLLAKLFHLVAPDVAVFGQKHVQRVLLVRAMVADLDMPIEIASAPTVREADGLAASRRNVHLSPGDRARALALPRALRAAAECWQSGVRDARALTAAGRAVLDTDPELQVDYFAVADPETLEPLTRRATRDAILLVAARVGRTRLVDNLPLAPNAGAAA